MPLRKKPLENIVRKGENAGNQHFLLFPQRFLPFPNLFSISDHLQMLSVWTCPKFCKMVKELRCQKRNLETLLGTYIEFLKAGKSQLINKYSLGRDKTFFPLKSTLILVNSTNLGTKMGKKHNKY